MRNVAIGFLIFCLYRQFVGIKGQSYQDVNDLTAYLLLPSRYNKLVRPSPNQSEVTNVTCQFLLTSLHSLDSVTGQVTLTAHFYFIWTDHLLTWDPGEYGNITKLVLSENLTWLPRIELQETVNGEGDFTESLAPTMVYSTGTVLWLPSKAITRKCSIDMTLFPFDSHECTFTFYIPSMHSSETLLSIAEEEINTLYAREVPNSEWEITSTSASNQLHKPDILSDTEISLVQYTMTLTRRSQFVIVHILLPMYLILALNLIVFLVPAQSGERVSFSVALYLAYIFSATAIIDSLPRNCLKMSYFSSHLLSISIYTTIGVFWSVTQVRLAMLQEAAMPDWLMNLSQKYVRFRKTVLSPGKGKKCKLTDNKIAEMDVVSLSHGDHHEEPGTAKEEDVGTKGQGRTCIAWADAVEALDTLFFFLSLLFLGVLTMTWFILLRTNLQT